MTFPASESCQESHADGAFVQRWQTGRSIQIERGAVRSECFRIDAVINRLDVKAGRECGPQVFGDAVGVRYGSGTSGCAEPKQGRSHGPLENIVMNMPHKRYVRQRRIRRK